MDAVESWKQEYFHGSRRAMIANLPLRLLLDWADKLFKICISNYPKQTLFFFINIYKVLSFKPIRVNLTLLSIDRLSVCFMKSTVVFRES